MRRSLATSSVISWRRWSPDCARLLLQLVDALALHVDDVAQLAGRCRRRRRRGRSARARRAGAASFSSSSRMPAIRSPFWSRKPDCRAGAGRVQVAVVQQVVGDLGEDVVGVELEADLGAVPAGVVEPRACMEASPTTVP